MRFSLRNLGLFVAWVAFVIALICQIRFEAIAHKWAWGMAPDLVWTVNVFFTLIVVLLAIATRSRLRIFWVGCAVVALLLIVFQATDLKPDSMSRTFSIWLLAAITPEGSLGAGAQQESHVMQLASVLVYSLLPLLSLLGGTFTHWVHCRSEPENESPISGNP